MKKVAGYVVLVAGLLLGASMVVFPATITQLSGLAVAQTATKWNSLKDMAFGDAVSSGSGLFTPCLWNGVTCDRARGSIANGQEVDVKRIGGATTPSDAFANPTTTNVLWVLNSVFNGTTWDRMRGSIANGVLTEKKTVGTTFFAVNRTNITTASVNLAFGFTSRKVMISTPLTNTAVVCIDWLGATAVCPAADTAGDGSLAPGTSLIIDDYAVTSLSVIAAAATQTVNVTAWN